jgi:hypothetical protein
MTTQQSTDKPKPKRVDIDSTQFQEVFANYDISLPEMESALASRLADRGWQKYEPTNQFRNALFQSFQDAYLQESGKLVIPDAVDVAADDATYWITRQYPAKGEPLETQIIQAYTGLVASIIPEYSRRGLDPHGEVQFLPPEGSSAPPHS